MANELTINHLVKLAIDGEQVNLIQQNLTLNVSDSLRVDKVLSIGTSEEDIDLDDVATPGQFFIANLDETNFVQFGPKDGGGAMELLAQLPPRVSGKPPLFVGPIPLASGASIASHACASSARSASVRRSAA